MASFYRFQRVRIVCCEPFPQLVGTECTLMEACRMRVLGEEIGYGWETDLPHPIGFDLLCITEDRIEPIKYLPAPEDFVTTERVYEPALPAYVGAA